MRGQKRGCKAHPPLPVVLTHLIWIRRVPVTAPGMSHQLVERKPGERVCIYPHKSSLEINYDTAKSEVPGTAYISSWIPTRCKGHCTYFLILGTGCNTSILSPISEVLAWLHIRWNDSQKLDTQLCHLATECRIIMVTVH